VKKLSYFLVAAIALPLFIADRLSLSPPAHAAELTLTITPLILNKDAPAQKRVGELVYLGGLVLQSPSKDFGGLSGLRINEEGIALAVSDAGSWISFALIEKNERLVGATGIGLAPLLDQNGNPGTKINRDAEAVEMGVTTAVSFEGDHRIWYYRDIDPAKPETFKTAAAQDWRLPAMMLWPDNGGAEAYCEIGPMRNRLLISEDAPAPQGSKDAFLVSETTELRFGFLPEAGFKPTDCVGLPKSQQALVLQRRFSPLSGVAASIVVADFSSVENGAIIKGREIARLAPPLSIDNMEGIAYVERKGHKYIYIISDDNFSGLQRSLLMKFEWIAPALKGHH
jgi:hypothetical protein